MTPSVKLAGVTITQYVVDGVEIRYGRTDVRTTVADPTSCTFDVVRNSSIGTLVAETIEIGQTVTVEVTVPAGTRRRFTGQVTDVQLSRDTATVIAVSGLLDRLGRATIPISTAAGTSATGSAITALAAEITSSGVWSSTPATVTASAGTVDVTVSPSAEIGALEALAAVAGSEPAGALWERLSPPSIVFSDQEDRRSVIADITLTPADVGFGYVAARRVGEKANRAVVSWTGGTVDETVPADVSLNGQYTIDYTTWLADESDATYLALRALGNYVSPDWSFDELFVPVTALSDAQKWTLAQLEVGSVLRVSPAIEPALPTRWFVEGWSETLGPTRWEITFYVSDVRLSRAPQRWSDVDPLITWSDVNTTGTTWIEACRIYIGETGL
jgi:hypothetical protein